MENRKWIVLSRTTWVNTAALAVLPLVLSPAEVKEVGELIGSQDIGALALAAHPVLNTGLRFVSWGSVGESNGGKAWWKSKTVRCNLLVLAAVGYVTYLCYDAEVSLKPALALLALAAINIYLRVTHTDRKVTLLPGPLGKII